MEKGLIFDYSKRTEECVACATSYLEVYYDRKLSNISVIVQELIGVNREAITLITKLLPMFEHHVGTTHRISEECYGEKYELLGGTG